MSLHYLTTVLRMFGTPLLVVVVSILKMVSKERQYFVIRNPLILLPDALCFGCITASMIDGPVIKNPKALGSPAELEYTSQDVSLDLSQIETRRVSLPSCRSCRVRVSFSLLACCSVSTATASRAALASSSFFSRSAASSSALFASVRPRRCFQALLSLRKVL